MGGLYDPRGTQGEPGDQRQGAAAERPQTQGGIQDQGDARMVAQDGPVAAEEHGDGADMGGGAVDALLDELRGGARPR